VTFFESAEVVAVALTTAVKETLATSKKNESKNKMLRSSDKQASMNKLWPELTSILFQIVYCHNLIGFDHL
jgi:hypothetical protein